jgi:hypothetical protein
VHSGEALVGFDGWKQEMSHAQTRATTGSTRQEKHGWALLDNLGVIVGPLARVSSNNQAGQVLGVQKKREE